MTSLDDGLLPMGCMVSAGSRIRLYILGAPSDQILSLPGTNTVALGGASSSQLLRAGLGAPQF